MAICGTKTHLASIKKGCFIVSTDHFLSLVLELRLKTSISRLINFSRSRGLEVSISTSSNCGAEDIELSVKSSFGKMISSFRAIGIYQFHLESYIVII